MRDLVRGGGSGEVPLVPNTVACHVEAQTAMSLRARLLIIYALFVALPCIALMALATGGRDDLTSGPSARALWAAVIMWALIGAGAFWRVVLSIRRIAQHRLELGRDVEALALAIRALGRIIGARGEPARVVRGAGRALVRVSERLTAAGHALSDGEAPVPRGGSPRPPSAARR